MFLAAVAFALALQNPFLVSTDWLAAHLDDPAVVVVEVGDRDDYAGGHIAGARFVDRRDLVADCEGVADELVADERLVRTFERAGVGDTKRIVVYSRNPLVAARAWFTLDYLGHGARTAILDGGFEKWRLERRALTETSVAYAPQPFTPDIRPGSLIRIQELKDLVRRRGTLPTRLAVIDARPARAFRGDRDTASNKRAGHLPDAVSVPWTANLATEEPPVLRPLDQLRDLYASAGVDRDALVVTYCRTGMEASMTYFVLRSLGYDVVLYDGSFVEWSASSRTAVVQ